MARAAASPCSCQIAQVGDESNGVLSRLGGREPNLLAIAKALKKENTATRNSSVIIRDHHIAIISDILFGKVR